MYNAGLHERLIVEVEDALASLREANTDETRCRTYSVCVTELENVRNRLFFLKELDGDEEASVL